MNDGTDSADTDKDELFARIIPLRRRGAKPPEPRSVDVPDRPEEHSVWDPPTGEPELLRRKTPMPVPPSTAAAPPTSAVRMSRRSTAIAAVGAAAITALAFVLAGGVLLHGPPGAASRPGGSFAVASTPAGVSEGAARQPTRPHGASGSRGGRLHGTAQSQLRVEQGASPATRTIEAAVHAAPASDGAPVRASAPVRQQSASASCEAQRMCASVEFGVER